MPKFSCPFFVFCMLFYVSLADGNEIQLIVVNNCKESIWPAILGTTGHKTPSNGGFRLDASEATVIEVPEGWSGRIWGRQGCMFNETGEGICQTGDCAGHLECKGIGGKSPATIVQMTLGTSKSAAHFYDVSLVDGFNLPVLMSPVGGHAGCGVASCAVNLNMFCPSPLVWKKNEKVVGCKSACLAAKTDRYCCTGDYANPEQCKPTVYSKLFKAFCPHAYSYAYDESTGLKTCRATQYLITFCPPKYEEQKRN